MTSTEPQGRRCNLQRAGESFSFVRKVVPLDTANTAVYEIKNC